MPIFNTAIQDNRIIFVSSVSIPPSHSVPSPAASNYQTLFDTGAQVTGISPRVVQELGLASIGDASITPASGKSVPTLRYRIRLDIPVQSIRSLPGGQVIPFTDARGMALEVVELPFQPNDFDVLMGMDFIALWHITTIVGGKFTLSI